MAELQLMYQVPVHLHVGGLPAGGHPGEDPYNTDHLVALLPRPTHAYQYGTGVELYGTPYQYSEEAAEDTTPLLPPVDVPVDVAGVAVDVQVAPDVTDGRQVQQDDVQQSNITFILHGELFKPLRVA